MVLFQRIKDFIQNFDSLSIYTDGSHKGRWGSWAYVVVRRGKIIREASGRELKTNSHRMEFQAAIEALSSLRLKEKATVHTDSRVLIKAMSENCLRVPTNPDQVEKLNALSSNARISWIWVKGHSGQIYNERCDQLCREAREPLS